MNDETKRVLHSLLGELETKLDADALSLIGPIRDGSEHKLRVALEPLKPRRERLAIVLHTVGGVVEVAERMVNIVRHFYREVVFIVPDIAMSAGTVFAMSGDAIMMDYASCLGPIDPQVVRDGKLVPALSYLAQFDRLVEKAQKGTLTEAEFLLMKTFDLAELHQFEMARDLSKSLLVRWLTTYKFKDWTRTETSGREVSEDERRRRAEEIANHLMNNTRWNSHGRGIPMKILREELNLRIDDLSEKPEVAALVYRYFSLVVDYVVQNNIQQFVHSREFL